MNYWDKIMNRLMSRAMEKKDEEMKDILSKFVIINNNVKHACLYKFIKQANLLYAIAFF